MVRLNASSQAKLPQAERAVKAFNKMVPTLDSFARVLTGKNITVRIGPMTSTDGKVIHVVPPYALGDDVEHARTLCDKRLEDERPACPACQVRETVLVKIYHEISHIAFGSFKSASPEQVERMVLKIDTLDKDVVTRIATRISRRASRTRSSIEIKELGMAVNPFLGGIMNALEDARVDTRMHEARPGTVVMQRAEKNEVITKGIKQLNGDLIRWSEADLNSQLTVGMLCVAVDFDVEGTLDPYVVAVLADPTLRSILAQASVASDVLDTMRCAIEALVTAQGFGFFKSSDPEENYATKPEPEPEPEAAEPPKESSDNEDTEDSEPESESDSKDSEGSESPADEDDACGGSDPEEPKSDDSSDGDSDPDDDAASSGSDEDAPDDADAAEGSEPNGKGEPSDDDSGDESSDDSEDVDGTGEDEGASEAESDFSGAGKSDTGVPAEGPSDPSSDSADSAESDSKAAGGAGSAERSDVEEDPTDSGDSESDSYTEEPKEEDAPTLEDLMPKDATFGDHHDVERAIEAVVGHDSRLETVDEAMAMDRAEQDAVLAAATYIEHFDTPSRTIAEVHIASDVREFPNQRSTFDVKAYVNETILGSSVLHMRRVFTDNMRGAITKNKRSGRVSSRVLGRRAWSDDDRLFTKKTQPGKKDYAVLIGIDMSGSTASTLESYTASGRRSYDRTAGTIAQLELKAAYAQAELCSRLGLKFAVYGHSGDSGMLQIFEVKSWNDPWNDKAVAKLNALRQVAANFDGHTIEYYRKRLDEINATHKILMYYSDGAMPAENYAEELAILKREIQICRKKGYVLMAVGAQTDAPREHGLDMVRIDSVKDIPAVVKHLGKRIMEL